MKLNSHRIVRNTLIYFALLVGYLFLYVINIENECYDLDEKESTSKVDFVYQQF